MSRQATAETVPDPDPIPDGRAEWERWREERTAAVSAPDGLLSLTGTYWLEDLADGTIPGLAGHWRREGDTVVREPDGGPAGGSAEAGGGTAGGSAVGTAGATVVLRPEGEPLLLSDGRKIVVIAREGSYGVRVWDPEAPARRAFSGIEAFDWDERWVVPGVFRPFEETRTVRLANADGRERGFGLGGELSFAVDGQEHTLSVAVEGDGGLWAVVADGTSGKTSFRFRFLYTPAPAEDGSLTVDLNRTVLPPCALGEGFLCPVPPPGNTLPFALEAGERGVLTR